MRIRDTMAGLALLAVCGLAAGCEHDPRPKERPHDVPLAAVWAGGSEGGSYFDCNTGGTTNQCSVWNDNTGVMLANGKFVLDKLNRGATTSELKFTGFDGTKIFLEGGLVLVPAK